MKRTHHLILALSLLLFTATGCTGTKTEPVTDQTPTGEPSLSIVEGATPSEESKAAMLAAKDALFTRLSGRLMEAMADAGPAGAIGVCSQEAVKIAKEVGAEHAVQIGRTGVRLRNPNNQPPDWAAALVEQNVDTPVFAVLSDESAAALLPIKLQAQCLMCHGPDEQIAPEIQQKLAQLYPDDRATGFKEGELRGWFWIKE
ncbi:hypothetical protein Enr13x_46130 [Stieleria neptunia]|uniref:Tll0287-like domain-containing protein n=1 Tax=Stieleria neptunia TaxID=2527979 RepID=A0A518HVA9_9BACT|nr:DUF3365 domain-containing protein [Stieleria neptunia]QDV44743.1 hypothetical protein Enr13x_46130 [Stieleria neptunia]